MGGTRLVALFGDFPEVAALTFAHGSHGPIVDNQDIDAAQAGEQIAQAAVGTGQSQVAEQSGGTSVENQVAIAAGLVGQGASQVTLANAGWTHQKRFSWRCTQPESAARERTRLRSSPRALR
jgi:hypothetical protein